VVLAYLSKLSSKPCKTEECAWPRSTILGRFFEFYKDLTSTYELGIKYGQQLSLQKCEDLFAIIRELESNLDIMRQDLLEKLFPDRPVRSDQERIVNLAVRVMMMVNCSAPRQSSALLEHGSHGALAERRYFLPIHS
jgi:hypothetical protein